MNNSVPPRGTSRSGQRPPQRAPQRTPSQGKAPARPTRRPQPRRVTADGPPAGIQMLLVLVGSLALVLVWVLWAFLIQESKAITDSTAPKDAVLAEPVTPTAGPEETPTQDTAALAQARDNAARLADTTTCTDPAADYNVLAELVTRSEEVGGLSGEDRQLIADQLVGIDQGCPKDHTLAVQMEVTGGTAPADLNDIAANTQWVTPGRPIPSGTIQRANFSTPDNNIHCTFEEDGRVSCSIYAYRYPSPQGCEGRTATYEVEETGEVAAGCEWRLRADTRAQDGDTIASDGFACTVGRNDVECWSELSGHGFAINRQGERIF